MHDISMSIYGATKLVTKWETSDITGHRWLRIIITDDDGDDIARLAVHSLPPTPLVVEHEAESRPVASEAHQEAAE